jgi:hypothetical protein
MFGTILSVVGGINTAFDLYKNVNTLVKGDDIVPVLNALDQMNVRIETLSDRIFYAPGLRGLADTRPPLITDARVAYELLEPVQRAVGENIVASGLISTPSKLELALNTNPWEVLLDIRPQRYAARPPNADLVPVMFVHNAERYIGWQMRGTLPMLFNCEMYDLPGLQRGLVTGASKIVVSPIDSWLMTEEEAANFISKLSQRLKLKIAWEDNGPVSTKGSEVVQELRAAIDRIGEENAQLLSSRRIAIVIWRNSRTIEIHREIDGRWIQLYDKEIYFLASILVHLAKTGKFPKNSDIGMDESVDEDGEIYYSEEW